jgi:hypothetical protein
MNTRNTLIAIAAATLPLAAAHAQKPAEPPGTSPDAVFQSLDADSDGRVSKTEAQVSQRVQSEFQRLDLNHDGFIDKKEFDEEHHPRTPQHN